MTQKLCYECKHIRVEQAQAGHPGYTSDHPMGIWCEANQWCIDDWTISRLKFKQYLSMAETCPSYVPDPELIVTVKGDE